MIERKVKTYKELQKEKDRLCDSLMQHPDVVGLGIGKVDGMLVIKVFLKCEPTPETREEIKEMFGDSSVDFVSVGSVQLR